MQTRAFLRVALSWFAACALTAYAQKGPETTLTELPQDHAYQRVLRAYMATLSEKDFTHGVTERLPIDTPTDTDPEYLYRQYILTIMHQPLVGTKRGAPAITAPPGLFMLSAIETPKGVIPPPVWPETLIAFAQWDYPGNLYRNSRALKLRAFVTATVLMVMFDNFAELNDGKNPPPIRPDWHGYQPVFWAAPYPGFKGVLPPDVQKAYEAGLKKIGERMLGWGVRGETCEHDLMGPVGLIYISRAINDPAFAQAVEARTRMLCTDPRYFHPAGYWVERGGIDTGFGGTANLFAVWAVLMTDWPFAREAVERTYRLRGHLILPDPDGWLTGPSHFNSRLGSPASFDQFAFDGARDTAAAMVTDEAAQFIKTPSPEVLKNAPGRRAYQFNEDIGETPRDSTGRHIRPDEIANIYPWKLRMWMTYNFPVSVNPGYELYRNGAFAHRQDLEKKNSPLLKSPFLRGENFIRDFEKAFVVTRQPGFAAILHTGPIGCQSLDDNMAQFNGPMGLSGGQLSAFWTPEAGSAMLGLRRWMSYDKAFDLLEEWRTWPNNSVSGVTAGGKVFTSARCARPEVACDIKDNGATVKVSGALVAMKVIKDPAAADPAKARDLMYDEPLEGKIAYARTFKIDGKGVSVETTLSGDGAEQVAELYEVLPVYLRDPEKQPKATPTTIEFQVGGKWAPATAEYQEKVTAVKLTRFGGAVLITFDRPRRVKLSPAVWEDTGFTKSNCRNVLIDLLESGDKAVALKDAKKVGYRIEPVTK